MNKFASFYLTKLAEEQGKQQPQKPGFLLKMLRGAVAGGLIGGLGGGGLGAVIGHDSADTAWDLANPMSRQLEKTKDWPMVGIQGQQMSDMRRANNAIGTAGGAGIGTTGGAALGAIIGGVANPLFSN